MMPSITRTETCARATSDRLAETRRLNAIREQGGIVFGSGATVRLFGSRVDDAARGGDIDTDWVAALAEKPQTAERLEAFVSRFGRIQETIVGKSFLEQPQQRCV